MSTEYIQSLIDPFDNQFQQPKLYDGAQQRSSGLRFRNTGNITLDAAGGTNYLVLLPGFSNGLCWKLPDTAGLVYLTTARYPTHVDDSSDRANISRLRLVSAGLQLSLLNSSDENEGYWEAVRIPIQIADIFQDPFGDYASVPNIAFGINDMANHHTFQTGKLRDIHRFQFKLNSTSPFHPFKTVPVVADEGVSTFDDAFDMVVIKVVGRVDAVTPSTLKYDVVSNQEVVYTENTSLSRLMTKNMTIPDIEMLHEATRYILPAIQIA